MKPTTHPSRSNLAWCQELENRFDGQAFTAHEAQEAGVGPSRLARLLGSGLLVHGIRGLYRLHDRPSEVLERAHEVMKAVPDSVIARRTSAWLLGEDARSPSESADAVPIECIVPRSRNPSQIQGIRCYQAEIPPDDIVETDGLRCTTPARTAADLLRWVTPPMALACVDQLVRNKYVNKRQIFDVLLRSSGERNVHRARNLTAVVDPRAESYGESWLRLRILDAGFPAPELQVPIRDRHGKTLYRLDLGWPRLRLGVEYDGEEFHSGRSALAADVRRREDLRTRFGWQVIGVGRGEVLGLSLGLERGIGELLGLEPKIRRRVW